MATPTHEDYLLRIKKELDLIEKEADAIISEKQKSVNLEKINLAKQAENREYPAELKDSIATDLRAINKKLMREVQEIVPELLSYNKHVNYMYLIVVFLAALLILSFVKIYVL
jgi:hypothetical protein